MRRPQSGFTLIELLIIISIISILALIVLQRVQSAATRAKESALKEDLRVLRQAVQLFYSDVGGYPLDLEQLRLTKEEATDTLPAVDAAGNSMNVSGYDGPYIVPDPAFPPDPFAIDGVWGYDNVTGHVFSTSTLTALDGTLYGNW